MKEFILKKKMANFYGFEGHPFMIRGNGELTLTKEGILFREILPKREYFIPIDEIIKVEIKRSHNLKTKLLPVLRIHYKERGETLIFGVCVGNNKDSLLWKEKIESLMKNRRLK